VKDRVRNWDPDLNPDPPVMRMKTVNLAKYFTVLLILDPDFSASRIPDLRSRIPDPTKREEVQFFYIICKCKCKCSVLTNFTIKT